MLSFQVFLVKNGQRSGKVCKFWNNLITNELNYPLKSNDKICYIKFIEYAPCTNREMY